MLHDAKRSVKVAYVKVMVKSWIMLGTTGKVRLETYQLVWCLVTQIEFVNRLVARIL